MMALLLTPISRVIACMFTVVAVLATINSFTGWMVDDAAVSIAYAKNLIEVGALTAQPGAVPVEGFSNPSWVALLSILLTLGGDVETIPYLGGILLIAAAARLMLARMQSPSETMAFTLAGLLLAIQPSTLIWSLSGLENSFLVYCATEILIRSHIAINQGWSTRNTLLIGLFSAIAALTRPEGIVVSLAYPISAFLAFGYTHTNFRESLKSTALAVVVLGGYIAFRLAYFGEIVPNTYFAKGGLTIHKAIEIFSLGPIVHIRLYELLSSLFGKVLAVWFVAILIYVVVFRFDRCKFKLLIPSVVFTAISALVYIFLPGDWMGEQRFGSLFYVGVYAVIGLVLAQATIPPPVKVFAITCLISVSLAQSYTRISFFSENPTISIREVEERSEVFEEWGNSLGIHRPSLLTADIGGMLLRNKLQVADLGMLIDATIAKSLGEYRHTPDIPRFHDYIFEEVKPDFIATRAYHSWIARLDDDPRFRKMYVPIREYTDLWILKRYGELMHSGDYIRKDLIEQHPDILANMHAQAQQLHYPFCMECNAPVSKR